MNAATGSLQRASPVPAWRQKLGAFWRWWSGELLPLLPGPFARMQASRGALVALEAGELALLEVRGAAVVEAARTPLRSLDPEGRRLALRDLLSRGPEAGEAVSLVLGHEEALRRTIRLPLATEENLAQVLAFEMDRLTPFKAGEVYFDYRVTGRDPAAGKLELELALARREGVDERLAKLREMGAAVQGIVLRDELARTGVQPLDLLPRDQRGPRAGRGDRLLHLGLAAAVAVLLAVALVLPALQKRARVVELLPVVAKAKQEAEATDRLARELERLVGDHNFLLGRRHAQPTAGAVIEDLSRLLPDDTWVQQFDLRTQGKVREVQIAGETSSSSKLIEVLEASQILRNAAPRGAVTRGSQPGTERFLIAAEVPPRPLPEAQPVAAMPVPLAPPVSAPPAAPKPVPEAKAVPEGKPVPSEAKSVPAEAKAAPAEAKPAGAAPK